MRQNQARNQVFCHFLKFGLLVFLAIVLNGSLKQCLTFSRGKTQRIIWGAQNWTKIGSKIRFFAIFSSLVGQFSFKLHKMIAWNNFQLLVAKSMKEIFLGPNLNQMGQNWVQNQVFGHFLKFGWLVFLEIAQNDSLEQFVTTSRSKTHEKKLGEGGSNFGQAGQN